MKIAACLLMLSLATGALAQNEPAPAEGLTKEEIAALKAKAAAMAAAEEAKARAEAAAAPAEKTAQVPAESRPAEAKAESNASFAPFPGGIVDKEWKKAYVTGVGGTLDAIDLATGKLLWRSAVQAIPLAIDGDRVYALSPSLGAPPALHVIGLSMKGEGKLSFKSDPISVEEWLSGDLAGKTLRAAVALEEGKMKLSWTAAGTIDGAAAGAMVRPGRRVIPRGVRSVAAEGNAVIDLQKGSVEESKTKMPIGAASTLVSHEGREYRLNIDAEANKAAVECRDLKDKKTAWQVDVQPMNTGGNAPVIEGAAPPIMIQPRVQVQMNQFDTGELFLQVPAR